MEKEGIGAQVLWSTSQAKANLAASRYPWSPPCSPLKEDRLWAEPVLYTQPRNVVNDLKPPLPLCRLERTPTCPSTAPPLSSTNARSFLISLEDTCYIRGRIRYIRILQGVRVPLEVVLAIIMSGSSSLLPYARLFMEHCLRGASPLPTQERWPPGATRQRSGFPLNALLLLQGQRGGGRGAVLTFRINPCRLHATASRASQDLSLNLSLPPPP